MVKTIPEPKKLDLSVKDSSETRLLPVSEADSAKSPLTKDSGITPVNLNPLSIVIPIPEPANLHSFFSKPNQDDKRENNEPNTSRNLSTKDHDKSVNKRKMSKSLKNFNPHGDSHIENDDSFIRRNNGAPKTPTLIPAKESRDSREPSKLLSHARPPTSEHAQKKRDNLSKIEDVKVEIRGDELLIFNTREELDNVPIDSLKASTIHDLSKNIIDKLNLDTIDHDEQLLLGSKLSSALRFVEVATKDQKKIVEKAERETRENEATYPPNDTMFEVVSNCEEDLLMIQIDQFQSIYKKEYLDKVLGDTWRDEGMHQMSLRHEAELNQLKKMHTEQMQELIDEMRRRKHRVKRIEQRMKHVGHIKKEYHEQESTSQLMEFESNSMRSRDHSFRGLFSNHDHLTDNLSRINVPVAGHRDNEFNHRDEHDLIAIPLFSDCQKTYPIIPTLILPTENKSEQLRQESMENGIYLDDKRHSDNVDAKTQQTPTDKFNEHVNSASFVISPIHQSVVNEQDNTTKDYTLKGSSKNLIGRGILLPLHQLSKEDCSNQDRSGPLQNGRPLTQRTCEDRLMNDCKGNKYKGSSEEVYSLNNLSPPQTPLNFTFDNLFIMIEVGLSLSRKRIASTLL